MVTDLGYVTESIKFHLRGADLLVLESNHDLEMLKVGPYPWSVKQRVMGRKGHLSNEVVSEFIRMDLDSSISTLVLGHLSEHNNHPEIVRNIAGQALDRAGQFAVHAAGGGRTQGTERGLQLLMIERYTRPEMGRIWSEENKFRQWLEVELAASEALAEMGEVPREAAAPAAPTPASRSPDPRDRARSQARRDRLHYCGGEKHGGRWTCGCVALAALWSDLE